MSLSDLPEYVSSGVVTESIQDSDVSMQDVVPSSAAIKVSDTPSVSTTISHPSVEINPGATCSLDGCESATDSDSANPNSHAGVNEEPVCEVPMIQLDGLSKSDLCAMQGSDESLTDLRECGRNCDKGYKYTDGVLVCTVIDLGVARQVIVVPQMLRLIF